MSSSSLFPHTRGAATFHRADAGPDVVQYTVTGELIIGTRDRLKALILEHLANGVRDFALNLAACGYIDSSGLGALVTISKHITRAGGQLVLEDLNHDLQTLFELTQLDTLFVIRTTAPSAPTGRVSEVTP